MHVLRSLVLLFVVFFSTAGYPTKKHNTSAPNTPAEVPAQETPAPGQDQGGQQLRPSTDSPSTIQTGTKPETPENRENNSHLCDEKHSIEAFAQIGSARSPQADPDGGVYFLSDIRDTPQLFHLKTENGSAEQLSSFPSGVSDFKLSPDGKKLLLKIRIGEAEEFEINLWEPGKKTTTLLTGRDKHIESIAWDPRSSWFVYTSNERNPTDFDLHRFDLTTRKNEIIAELSGRNSITDVSPDGKLVSITTEHSPSDMDVNIWDLAAKQLTNLTKHSGEAALRDGMFTGDAKSVFVLSDAATGFPQLYLFSFAERGKKTPRLFTTGKWGVEKFALSPSRTSLAYLLNEDGYSRIKGLEIDIAGRKEGLMPVPAVQAPRGIVLGLPSFASPPHQRRSFFFSESSSVRSSDIWLWESPKQIQWTHSSQGLSKMECFAREKIVKYLSFDKREIPAFLFYPKDTQGPIPFIIYVHDGPGSQYRPVFNKTFQYFIERGFGVFAPNIRGSSGYGRDYFLLDNENKRTDVVKDIIEGSKWLIDKRYTAAGQMAIYGERYGESIVLQSIEVAPDLFSAASAFDGATNLASSPKSISPVLHPDKIKTPLIIFHGANDPPDLLVAELTRRSIPVESKVSARDIMEQAKTTVYFFEKYLIKKSP